ncbi:MAG: NAD(P)H-dependent oxidoreductase [Proteobacteria bacterium]|nr:NAD(P)H-dependent oxidoreductase [Pseudomonadota bacterium]
MGIRNVAVLLGSLQKHSCNRRIAHALVDLAPRSLRFEIVEISRLPLYRKERVASPPADWVLFRQQILAADAVLFMATENSRTVPGILENALQVGACGRGPNAWAGKPGGIVSISPEGVARGRTERHLRSALLSRDVPVMDLPELPLRPGFLMFDDEGRVANAEFHRFLQQFVTSFQHWVSRGYLH